MIKDEKVLAYCNMFGVLGAIPRLISLDPDAAALVAGKNISIGFSVKDGPSGTRIFRDGRAEMRHGIDRCSIKLYFPTCEKFNGMIDGTATPIPVSGFWHLGFLLGDFTKLTDSLSSYLRPTKKALAIPEFFRRSTLMMLDVIAGAVVEIGNHDKIGKFSASNIVDGDIRIAIGDEAAIGIRARNSHLSLLPEAPRKPFSEMRFADLRTARDLFDGRINAVAAVGEGKVRISGMISQIDNINRILDRVAIYLA